MSEGTITNIQTGETARFQYTDEEAIAMGFKKSDTDLEAEVQNAADAISLNGDRDMAMAMATIDLVIAARDGQLAGKSLADIRKLYRDQMVVYLRQKRGI